MNKFFFQKMHLFFNFEIIYFSIIYYNILIWVVKLIQSVAYDNYDDFQHFTFMFSQNFISLFWGLFND
jgi:hypothetical protein